MIRLHLVGATDDLKNLVFSRRRGAKTGTFMVQIEDQLQQTLDEVARLRQEAVASGRVGAPATLRSREEDASVEAGAEEQTTLSADGDAAAGEGSSRTSSQLSPKEIQSLLRAGKTVEEVARMAETDVAWVIRFTGPIIAERGGVVEAVKAGLISRPRLGRSRMAVGDAIVANLRGRKINLPHEILDEGWSAVRREGYWEVTFRYLSRGQSREARFAYDLEKRSIRHLNALASQLGWYGETPSDPSKAKLAASSDRSEEAQVSPAGESRRDSREKKSATASNPRPSRRPARTRRPASTSPASTSPSD